MNNTYFYDEDALIERLTHGYNQNEKFIFLVGSGVTSRVGASPGVLGVDGIIDLVRSEFAPNDSELNKAINKNPILRYQAAFGYLGSRRKSTSVSRIIRRAVLAGRLPGSTHEPVQDKLTTVLDIDSDDCKKLCELIENDLHHWHVRPGVKALGAILVGLFENFGSVILTTNFDPLLRVSVMLAGGNVQCWTPSDFFDLQSRASNTCNIVHLHGDWSSVDTLHTRLVLEKERPGLEAWLMNLMRTQTIVVVGYGGWNDVFTKAVTRSLYDRSQTSNVLWGFFQSSEQELNNEYELLISKLQAEAGPNRVLLYKGIDSDVFFPRLLRQLRPTNESVNTVAGVPANVDAHDSSSINVEILKAESAAVARKIRRSHHEPGSKLIDKTEVFLSLLESKYQDGTERIVEKTTASQVPNFLLFNRENRLIMVILAHDRSVDPFKLQKTFEPQMRSTLVLKENVERVGFVGGRVHPMFEDPGGLIDRIICDGGLLAQTILFPDSRIDLPVYRIDGSSRTVSTPIGVFMDLLATLHGPDKIVFANVSSSSSSPALEPVLRDLICERPVSTRFAPTPSNALHLGNARTALATFLLGLKHPGKTHFYLRIDDTDPSRSKQHLIATIKDELKWMGVRWDDKRDIFQQSDEKANANYFRLLRILDKAGLTVYDSDGTVSLKSLPPKSYCGVYVDWREGTVINHHPPHKKNGRPRKVKLLRPGGGNVFYPYAGLVDDIRFVSASDRISCVVRDNRQRYLTKVQSHIRAALELARKGLQGNEEAARWFRESGIDPLTPIPLPIYFHVPYVVGKVGDGRTGEWKLLRKRSTDDESWLYKYSLQHLKHLWMPETIAAYLLSTILAIPAKANMRDHVERIAFIFGKLGVHAGLHFFSQELSLDDLVPKQEHIPCDLDRLPFIEQRILRQMPYWKLSRALTKPHSQNSQPEKDTIERVSLHLDDFASLSQARALMKRPRVMQLSTRSRSFLQMVVKVRDDEEYIRKIRDEIIFRRKNLKSLEGAEKNRAYQDLKTLLGDLRMALTAADSSPKVETLLSVLGDFEAAIRVRASLS